MNPEIEQLLTSTNLKEDFFTHFSYLCASEDTHYLLKAIADKVEKVEKDEENIIFIFDNEDELTCHPMDPAEYARMDEYPSRLRKILTKHSILSFPDEEFALHLGLLGGLEQDFIADSEVYKDYNIHDLFVPITDYSDWWLYHMDGNQVVEDMLVRFDHGTCDPQEGVTIDLGELFLRRMVEVMELDIALPKLKKESLFGGDLPSKVEIKDGDITEVPKEVLINTGLKKLTIYKQKNLKTIPASFGNYSKLTELDLGYNGIEKIEADFSKMRKVTRLKLENNKLCSLPSGIGKMSKITHFYAQKNT